MQGSCGRRAQGAGIGLRLPHIAQIVADRPPVNWLEVHPENFLANPHAMELLEELTGTYPISAHIVGLSLGSAEGLDMAHLLRLRRFVDRINPCLVSVHLAWSVQNGIYLNDLLPLPYDAESLGVLVRNVDAAQQALGARLLVENPSRYLNISGSTMPETAFLVELVRTTGCGLLCDVSNILVSATNLGFPAEVYLAQLPGEAVGELHLGGFEAEADDDGALLVDTHGVAIADESWTLYRAALERFGPVPTLIEWDNNLPPLDTLRDELARASVLLAAAAGRVAFG